jgi:hypothetical protein
LATACGSASSDALFNTAGAPSVGELGAGGHQITSGGSGNAGGRTPGGGAVNAGGSNVSNGGFVAAGGVTQSSGSVTSAGGMVELGGGTSTGGVIGRGGTGGVTGTGGATQQTCTDRVKNQDETDIDCGGTVCGPCVPGQICKQPRDCTTNVCPGGLLGFGLCRAATCADTKQNGDETDVDCGGSACDPCPTGDKCKVNTDCVYGSCQDKICTCTALTCKQMTGACGPNIPDGCGNLLNCGSCALLCSDTMKDGNETAVDCGGPDCGKCPNNSPCSLPRDCESGVCAAASAGAVKTCRPPDCMDGVKNGNETGKDCGGPTCPKCPNGNPCNAPTDCASGLCSSNVCACKPLTCADYPTECGGLSNGCSGTIQCPCKALCMDMMKNGHETDVDCGGADCAACMTGQACILASDCASGTCDTSTLVCQ